MMTDRERLASVLILLGGLLLIAFTTSARAGALVTDPSCVINQTYHGSPGGALSCCMAKRAAILNSCPMCNAVCRHTVDKSYRAQRDEGNGNFVNHSGVANLNSYSNYVAGCADHFPLQTHTNTHEETAENCAYDPKFCSGGEDFKCGMGTGYCAVTRTWSIQPDGTTNWNIGPGVENEYCALGADDTSLGPSEPGGSQNTDGSACFGFCDDGYNPPPGGGGGVDPGDGDLSPPPFPGDPGDGQPGSGFDEGAGPGGTSGGGEGSGAGSEECIGENCGAGEGTEGGGAGGAFCSQPPTCADPNSIQCAQLVQDWQFQCQPGSASEALSEQQSGLEDAVDDIIERLFNNPDAVIEAPELDQSGFVGPSCPGISSVTALGASMSFDFAPLCWLASVIGTLVIISAALISIGIVIRS